MKKFAEKAVRCYYKPGWVAIMQPYDEWLTEISVRVTASVLALRATTTCCLVFGCFPNVSNLIGGFHLLTQSCRNPDAISRATSQCLGMLWMVKDPVDTNASNAIESGHLCLQASSPRPKVYVNQEHFYSALLCSRPAKQRNDWIFHAAIPVQNLRKHMAALSWPSS